MFTDFYDNEKCVTKRNNQAAVQVCRKIPTCVFHYCMEKKKMYLVSEIQINAEMQQAVLNPARAQGVPELSPSWS